METVTAMTGTYSFLHPVHGIVYLIDTPGFDDTFTSDTDILKNIAVFLSGSYRRGAQLTGIVYIHRISDNRLTGSSLRNIKMFKELCGDDAYKHVVLSTSMWGKEDYSVSVGRESELKDENGFWGFMHSRGSPIMRWDNDRASALSIVDHLLKGRMKNGPATLQIQRELVDENRELERTSAGQQVNKDLAEAKRKWAAEIEQLREEHQQAMEERDRDLAERLQKQEEDLQDKLKQADKAQEDLKVNLEQLLKEKTEEYEKTQKKLQEDLIRATEQLDAYETERKQILNTRKKDEELYNELRKQYADERKVLDARDAKRAKDIEDLEKSLKDQYEQEQGHSKRREEEVNAKIKKGKDWKRYLAACLPPLMGIGMIALGVMSGNSGLMASGGSMMFGGGDASAGF